MKHCVFYTPRKQEGQQLLVALREETARVTEQDLECQVFGDAAQAINCLREQEVAAIGWDVSEPDSRDLLAQVRKTCQKAFVLVLAAAETSPLSFLTPAITPSSLIIRPFTQRELHRVAKEILHAACQEEETDSGCFLIRKKQESKRIPYASIYYFEAREGRVYVRLRREEIGFSGTLEQLKEDLPANFHQCHRSFIVNLEKIDTIQFSQNLIGLWDGFGIPLSRGFKKAIKESYHDGS